MKVLVTGGAGFIGSNFVRNVLNGTLEGYSKITVLDKLTYAGNMSNLELLPKSDFVYGDICDPEVTMSLASMHDVIINFAAESHVDRSITEPQKFLTTNVLGTQNLLESARLNRVKKFIQVSTDEVYGSIATGSFTESDQLQPNSPYAASKASADLIARSYFRTHSQNVIVTRSSNNFGPYQFPEKLIPLFVTNLLEGKKLPIYGDGNNSRDWLHVDDHCRGIHLAALKGEAGEVYNLGGGTEITNLQLTGLILEQLDKSTSEIEFVKDRAGHDFRYSVEIIKAQRLLGYNPEVDFLDGLSKTIEWYKNNESWWKPLKS